MVYRIGFIGGKGEGVGRRVKRHASSRRAAREGDGARCTLVGSA
jgi:hypothetical protein